MKLTAEEEVWLEGYREILSKQFPGVVDQIIVFGCKARELLRRIPILTFYSLSGTGTGR
jgi:hypothetical protein